MGPFDPTGRWASGVQRLQQGGEALAPGHPGAPVQFIDARDAAGWMPDRAERSTIGAFNLTGPAQAQAQALTMGEFLNAAQATLNPAARLLWVEKAFVPGEGVAPWSDLPVWLPQASQALHQVDIGRALATGLICRPLMQMLRDTAAWAALPAAPTEAAGPARPAVGLAPAHEAALLATWRANS